VASASSRPLASRLANGLDGLQDLLAGSLRGEVEVFQKLVSVSVANLVNHPHTVLSAHADSSLPRHRVVLGGTALGKGGLGGLREVGVGFEAGALRVREVHIHALLVHHTGGAGVGVDVHIIPAGVCLVEVLAEGLLVSLQGLAARTLGEQEALLLLLFEELVV
jgi:hypothetical protein